jgi:uncharacterized oxidoreductase
MRLTGNTIMITGGTSGIGLAFAEEFLKRGNKVIICGRRENRLAEIKKKYPDIITRVSDVCDADDRQELAAWVLESYPAVNVLINNAGVQLMTDLTQPVQLSKIKEEVETNLIAPIHLSSLFAPRLSGRENAAIINISSGLAFVPIAFMPVYCATKAAIHSITLSMRMQLKDKNVKVFEIAPPAVDTELGHDRREDKTESHGGLPVSDFIREAMEALENDVEEAAIAGAKFLREKREAIFENLNGRSHPGKLQ